MPLILAQKESRREPPSGWGRFKFMPCAFAEARPLAFKPPASDLPSLRVHAGDFFVAMIIQLELQKELHQRLLDELVL